MAQTRAVASENRDQHSCKVAGGGCFDVRGCCGFDGEGVAWEFLDELEGCAVCFQPIVRIERGVTDSCLCRFVSLLYTPEGQQVAEKLWRETLHELRFANVEGILASMEKK